MLLFGDDLSLNSLLRQASLANDSEGRVMHPHDRIFDPTEIFASSR